MSDTEAAQTEGSDRDPITSFSQRRRKGVKVTTAAAVALGLALGGGAVAGAATQSAPSPASASTAPSGRPPFGGSPPVAVGTVKSVGTGSFTITTHDGTRVTVNVGSSTTYHDRGMTRATLADVTVGGQVAVFGTETSDTVTATSVGIGAPPSGGPGAPGGPRGAVRPSGSPPSGSPPSGESSWSPTASS